MRTYHVGLIKGSGCCYPLHRNGHAGSTLVLQMRANIDHLSSELWKYLGEFETTKARYKTNKVDILAHINATFNTDFRRLVID